MNVRDIIEKYLRENGYDGLAGEDCGCGLDDLFACEDGGKDCVPAYRTTCDGHPKLNEYGEEDHGCFGSPHEMFTTEKPSPEGGKGKP